MTAALVPGPGLPEVTAVLADPGLLTSWFQPIVDTATGRAAGWEALARFAGTDGGPSPWGPSDFFAAAHAAGLAPELEALALRSALARLDDLPPDTFLTVNVSPAAVTSGEVAAVFAEHPDLSRIIVEITETEAVQDVHHVSSVCAGIRSAGGTVAVDDAGAGYAGLALIAQLRPQLVKVDRELVSGCDTDPVRLSLMEVLGVWAAGMDAWLLAEGVETAGEYGAVVALGVPLVQGWYTGRAAPIPTGPAPEVVAEMRHQRARVGLVGSVAAVMAPWPAVAVDAGDLRGDPAPTAAHVLTERGRPVAVVRPGPDGVVRTPVSLRVRPSEDAREALRRAMAREAHLRFDPLVVADGAGVPVGVVTVEALVGGLLETRETRGTG